MALRHVFPVSLGNITHFYALICYTEAVQAFRSDPGLEPISRQAPVSAPVGTQQHVGRLSSSESYKSFFGVGAKVGEFPQITGMLPTDHPSPAAGQGHGKHKSSTASVPFL